MMRPIDRDIHHVGAVPWGWRLGPDGLEPDPAERATADEARRLRAAGLSLAAVAATLDEGGWRARRGRRLNAGHVRRMLGSSG